MTPHITTQASTIRSGKHSTTLIISSMNRRNVRYQSLDRPVKRRRKVPESILKNGYNSLPRGTSAYAPSGAQADNLRQGFHVKLAIRY